MCYFNDTNPPSLHVFISNRDVREATSHSVCCLVFNTSTPLLTFSAFTVRDWATSRRAKSVFFSCLNEWVTGWVTPIMLTTWTMYCVFFLPLFSLYSNCLWSRQPRSHGRLQSADTHARWLVTFTEPRTVRSLWAPRDVGHYCAVILIKGAFNWLCWLVTGLFPCERTYVQRRTVSGKRQLGWQAPFYCSSAHAKSPPKLGHIFVSGWFVAVIHNVCVFERFLLF